MKQGLAALAAGALLVTSGCGEQTSDPADGVAATPRAIAAVVDEVVPLAANRYRGDFSAYGHPEQIEAEVDFGVDPEGTESGAALTVRAGIARLADLPERDRRFLDCATAGEYGGCTEESVGGGTLLLVWADGSFESDPGYVAYRYVHDGLVVSAAVSGPFIDRDPRAMDLGVELDDLRAVALDPRLTFAMDAETLAAGRALGDDYRGDEEPAERPEALPTEPEALAAAVVRYADDLRPTLARPSTLDVLGPDAVGAHLEFPATKRFAASEVDILTVAGRPPVMDPMPCGDTNDADPLPEGASCFGWSEDNVVTWAKATAREPGTIWVYGYHQDEVYLREESIAIRIVTPDLTFDLFTDEYPRAFPDWWLAGMGPLATLPDLGPETTDPTAYDPVPNWQD